jgi:hypothetical protein
MLIAAQRRPVRAAVVPAARVLPTVFDRLVNALA